MSCAGSVASAFAVSQSPVSPPMAVHIMGVPIGGKGIDEMNTESAISRGAQTLVLSLVVFALAFGAHEVMHLLVLYAVGGHGSIIVRPWRMGMFDASIGSLHVQPDQPLGLIRQLLVNFLGPVLAAIPLAVLLMYVRDPVARAAMGANVAILGFYAIIEAADLLIEQLGTFDLGVLTFPE